MKPSRPVTLPQPHQPVTEHFVPMALYHFNGILQSAHMRLKQRKMGEEEILKLSLGLFLFRQGENDADSNFFPANHCGIGAVAFICQAECFFG